MSYTLVPITPAQIAATATAYYTVGANKKARVLNLTVCNTTGAAHTYTVHRVPSGGTASATNMIISARPIAAGETQLVRELIGKVLAAGDTIQALADAATSLSIDGSVAEVV